MTRVISFFIPENALQTTQQPEQLPPLTSMTIGNQQAPIVMQMEQQKQAQQKEALAKANAQQTPTPAPAEQNSSIENEEDFAQQNDSDINPFADISSSTEAEKIASVTEVQSIPEVQRPTDPASNDPCLFLFEDYKKDIKNITAGIPFRNQRLIDMIAAYKDEIHEI